MSFMNSGAECSTSQNPLSQFTKHASEDRSLQYERVAGGRPPVAMSMRSGSKSLSTEDQQIMDRFVNGASNNAAGSNVFAFDSMRREVNGIVSPVSGPSSNSWASEFNSGPSNSGFVQTANSASMINHVETSKWGSEFSQRSGMSTPIQQAPQPVFNNYRSFTPQFGVQRIVQPPSTAASSSKVVELADENWEAQFRQIEEASKQQENKNEPELKDIEMQDEEFNAEYSEENFENVWNKIKSQVLDNVDDWSAKDAWDRDYDQFTTSRPDFGDYQFEENNPYLDQDDPYTVGVNLMDTGAKLSVAALCFEAAVQRNPDHVEAWGRLGAAQAQNEKEDPAIRALERCVKLDATNLTALMNLSVSYTNEGLENAAYATLEKWLATKYPDVVNQARSQEPQLGNEDRFQLHSRVTELFIRAAQLSPDGANMDVDVQVGLGVLFYGNEEYDKAIDCFNAALTVRPNDPLLWNRLGATLANSSKSEAAIEAYYKALEIRPAFVRARYNLGVSCINIGCYKEAAQHLLAALSLHKTDGPEDDMLANQSTNLYETLRRIFLAMERRDLVEKVGNGMDVNEFRNEFEF